MERWEDRSTFSIQTNNSLEAINRKRRDAYRRAVSKVLTAARVPTAVVDAAVGAIAGWLENCGPTSMVNLLDEAGYDTRVRFSGPGTIQAEDALAVWMNDVSNQILMLRERPGLDPRDILLNEIPQCYPAAIKALFGATGRYIPMITFGDLARLLDDGEISGAMICLKDPGHYLAVVHYDPEDRALIYRDPWPGRIPGSDGFNLWMLEDEWSDNVHKFVVAVYPPEV